MMRKDGQMKERRTKLRRTKLNTIPFLPSPPHPSTFSHLLEHIKQLTDGWKNYYRKVWSTWRVGEEEEKKMEKRGRGREGRKGRGTR